METLISDGCKSCSTIWLACLTCCMYSAKIEKDNCCTLLKGIPIYIHWVTDPERERERESLWSSIYNSTAGFTFRINGKQIGMAAEKK